MSQVKDRTRRAAFGLCLGATHFAMVLVVLVVAAVATRQSTGGPCSDSYTCFAAGTSFLVWIVSGYAVVFALWLLGMRAALRRTGSERGRLSSAAVLHLVLGGTAIARGVALGASDSALLVAAFIVPAAASGWAWTRSPYTAWWSHPGW